MSALEDLIFVRHVRGPRSPTGPKQTETPFSTVVQSSSSRHMTDSRAAKRRSFSDHLGATSRRFSLLLVNV
jgi:hypothetical protein